MGAGVIACLLLVVLCGAREEGPGFMGLWAALFYAITMNMRNGMGYRGHKRANKRILGEIGWGCKGHTYT